MYILTKIQAASVLFIIKCWRRPYHNKNDQEKTAITNKLPINQMYYTLYTASSYARNNLIPFGEKYGRYDAENVKSTQITQFFNVFF